MSRSRLTAFFLLVLSVALLLSFGIVLNACGIY